MTSRARVGPVPVRADHGVGRQLEGLDDRGAAIGDADVGECLEVVAARLELGARERQRLGLVEGRQDERGVVAGLERLGIGAQRAGPRLSLGPVGRDDEDEPAPVWHSGGRDRPDRPAIAQGLDPRGCHPSRALPREPLGLGPGVRRARRPLGRICGRPERRDQRLVVGLEQEALAGELVAGRKRPRRERHSPGGDAPAALGRRRNRRSSRRRSRSPAARTRAPRAPEGRTPRRGTAAPGRRRPGRAPGSPRTPGRRRSARARATRDGLECLHGLLGRLAAVEGARRRTT